MSSNSDLRLQFMTISGKTWKTENLDPSLSITKLKQMAFDRLLQNKSSQGSSKSVERLVPEHFRVIFPKEHRTLVESHTIKEEKLENNDLLLITIRRSETSDMERIEKLSDIELKGPTASQILKATSHLEDPAPTPTVPATEVPIVSTTTSVSSSSESQSSTVSQSISNTEQHESLSEVRFQTDLRKILISLIPVMESMLIGSPESQAICEQLHKKIKRRLALLNAKTVEGTTISYPDPPEFDSTPRQLVIGILELRKREFSPNAILLQALKLSGFENEGEMVDALRVSRNNKAAAAKILEGLKKGTMSPEILDDTTPTGLGPDAIELFNALTSNPIIRLGLTNPKLLIAFFNILETPVSVNACLNDPEFAPTISTIFKLYNFHKQRSH